MHTQEAGDFRNRLVFLVDELAPALRQELPLDGTRQTLFGHSLAGQFVLQALAARPDAFRTWAAISPSIWWDAAGLKSRLAATLPQAKAPSVFMGVGEWEGAVPPWQRAHPGHDLLVARRAQRDMVGHAQALQHLTQALERGLGLRHLRHIQAKQHVVHGGAVQVFGLGGLGIKGQGQ